MYSDLIKEKAESFGIIADAFNSSLNSGDISKTDDENQPYVCEINPKDIGLEDRCVDAPIFYEGKIVRHCRPEKLRIYRISELNKTFYQLDSDYKENLILILAPILIKYDYIYKIIEIRNHPMYIGYVSNHIEYICYGSRKYEINL